jgi:aldehyde dehydrogenase (NAD+)
MVKALKNYINNEWVEPTGVEEVSVINPATEETTTTLKLGSKEDVDRATKAAKAAFEEYGYTTREERVKVLEQFLDAFEKRKGELAQAITEEMGAPKWLTQGAQTDLPFEHIKLAIENLKTYEFEIPYKLSLVKKVPIGVAGIITAWNWPVSVAITKIVPALATGCTIVYKPSEYSPLSAQILAEIFDEIDIPKGTFNMVYGTGEVVGNAISEHPDIPLVSITGSVRAGVEVAKHAAPQVKRVVQELGGKSPNILLPDSDISELVKNGIKGFMMNSAQSCSAPSRILVPKDRHEEVKQAVLDVEKEITVGTPDSNAYIGPVVNKNQYNRIQEYIQSGIEEGATVVFGGPGKPEGLEIGFYIRPTAFMDTTPDMRIVREEIFGPVIVIQEYETVEEAVKLANDTEYGLAAYVQGKDWDQVKTVANRIHAGQIYLNGPGADLLDVKVPFGGFKKSGNGREWGVTAFEDYLEYKSLIGYFPENR